MCVCVCVCVCLGPVLAPPRLASHIDPGMPLVTYSIKGCKGSKGRVGGAGVRGVRSFA